MPNGKFTEKTSLRLAQGLAVRGDAMLLVASRYPSHPEPLWNLPGGRVEPGELLPEAVAREIAEETALRATVGELAYVSESYDLETHVITTVFRVEVEGTIALPGGEDHVVEARWVPVRDVPALVKIAVVREPLLVHLHHGTRYFGTHDAGVRVRWPASTI